METNATPDTATRYPQLLRRVASILTVGLLVSVSAVFVGTAPASAEVVQSESVSTIVTTGYGMSARCQFIEQGSLTFDPANAAADSACLRGETVVFMCSRRNRSPQDLRQGGRWICWGFAATSLVKHVASPELAHEGVTTVGLIIMNG